MSESQRVLVTGATGYIGGRLIPELLEAGHSVRAMARTPSKLTDRPWVDDVDIIEADATNPDDVARAVDEIDVVYYLVHSMGSDGDFAKTERSTASTFANACHASGVRRIVYLGGIYPDDEQLSHHLESRHRVGEILLNSGVSTIVLQAAVILGSGSASFEMMRYLTERLPAMIAPKWVTNRVQPIAVRDVLRYLVAAATIPDDLNRAFDIGGPEVLTYRDMMQRYAAVAELPKRLIVTVPVLTPWLASHWVGAVTPVPSGLAKPLVGSLIHEVVCKEHDIKRYIPDPAEGLLTFEAAVRLALTRVADRTVITTFGSAGGAADTLPEDPDWTGGDVYFDVKERLVNADRATTWTVIESIGGDKGWYSWDFAWQVRGVLDQLIGGPGLRRGRRHPTTLRIGDEVDFWRVEHMERGRMLRLRAEMKLPGRAWLQFTLDDDSSPDKVNATQRAIYYPKGLLGRAYWFAVLPFHGIVFNSMISNIANRAEELTPERQATKLPNETKSLPHIGVQHS